MADTQIKLSLIWVALMLIYLLGDVLRIFSGDYLKMMDAQAWGQNMWLFIAMLMVIPILMVVLTFILPQSVSRWANIIVAIFFVVFNLFGLPYPGMYDNFLIILSFAFNGMTIWYAWTWVVT